MIDNDKAQKMADRIMRSRIRTLQDYGFFGLLLMHAKFAVDENCSTASTDGERIYFGPDFTDRLSDWELDFVMMHEILHIALKHCFRGENLDKNAFNIACDIVVNSNIMKSINRTEPIVLKHFGEAEHLTPNGQEGHLFTAEEVYEMLPKRSRQYNSDDGKGMRGKESRGGKGDGKGVGNDGGSSRNADNDGGSAGDFKDDHSKWNTLDSEEAQYFQEKWDQYIIGAAEATEARMHALGIGTIPLLIDRILRKLREPQLDWRTILNTFVQEEITDYSFTPPDRRFEDSPFFLPDYNEKEEYIKDILFMIDASGSMSDEAVTTVFSEVKSSIEQFNGKLTGKLGFFDHEVTPPVGFSSIDDLLAIKPKGGGGTSFKCVFKYVNDHMQNNPLACIIMLTDGYADWPEKMANDIPVLWLLTNELVNPPWGTIARVKV